MKIYYVKLNDGSYYKSIVFVNKRYRGKHLRIKGTYDRSQSPLFINKQSAQDFIKVINHEYPTAELSLETIIIENKGTEVEK